MKINRTFCLDVEIAKELRKRSNQSYLVNQLLKKYFFDDGINQSISMMKTTQIAAALHARVESEFMKTMLLQFISSNRDEDL